jgi:hypothetical protein
VPMAWSADIGEDVNQEADTARHKPVLNQQDFQRLLAAAYLLQVHHDHQPSVWAVQRLGVGHASSFSVGKIVQRRTPSVMIRDRHLQAGQPDAIPGNETSTEPRIRLGWYPSMETVPHRMNALLRRPTSWRTVEPLAIAIVFCMMMALSIHRLSAVPSRTSLASGMLEEQNNVQPARAAEQILALSQPVVTRNSRQLPNGNDTDIVAENVVIHHQKRAVNVPGKSSVWVNFSRDAGIFEADTVVRYGSDVKMWSKKP